jgi:hypothetical protein
MDQVGQNFAQSVFTNFGLLPLVGIPLVVAALALWGVVHFWPDDKPVAGLMAVGVVLALIVTAHMQPLALSKCRHLYVANRSEFTADKCYNLPGCTLFGCP